MQTEHTASPSSSDEQTLPLFEEELSVSKRSIERGRMRVTAKVRFREEHVRLPLEHQDVEVQRVPINQVVTEIPAVREEDGVTIVPVVHEELVVQKRLVLREEIHIRKRIETTEHEETVQLRYHEPLIERLPAPSEAKNTEE